MNLASLIAITLALLPLSHSLSLPSLSRLATYPDIIGGFKNVYQIGVCPSKLSVANYSLNPSNIAQVSASQTTEDTSICAGTSPLLFLSQANFLRENQLNLLGLAYVQDLLDENANAKEVIARNGPTQPANATEPPANATLLVGWHAANRTCGTRTYKNSTFYIIMREDYVRTFEVRRQDRNESLAVPMDLSTMLLMTTSDFCVLINPATRATPSTNVVMTSTFNNGTVIREVLTPSGRVVISSTPMPSPTITPAASTQPAMPSPSTAAASAAATPAVSGGATTTPAASTPGPSPSTNASSVPSTTSPPTAQAPGGAGTTPTASPVIPPSTAASTTSPSPSGQASASPQQAPGGAGTTPTASPVIPPSTVASTTSPSPSGQASASPQQTPGGAVIGTGGETGGSSPEPSLEGEDDGSACFPGSAKVLTRGGVKDLESLEVGETVWTPDGWSEVLVFTHRQYYSRNSFVRIYSNDVPLLISANHYLPVNGVMKAARLVRMGDVIRTLNATAVVEDVDVVNSIGLFNPQTQSGSLFVNNIAVSTYTTAVQPWLAHHVLMRVVTWIRWLEGERRLGWLDVLSRLLEDGAPRIVGLIPGGKAVVA